MRKIADLYIFKYFISPSLIIINEKYPLVNLQLNGVPPILFTYKGYKARIRVSPFERQGFPPAGKSLPVLTTLSSRFSLGTMPALFRMAFSGIYPYPGLVLKL